MRRGHSVDRNAGERLSPAAQIFRNKSSLRIGRAYLCDWGSPLRVRTYRNRAVRKPNSDSKSKPILPLCDSSSLISFQSGDNMNESSAHVTRGINQGRKERALSRLFQNDPRAGSQVAACPQSGVSKNLLFDMLINHTFDITLTG